MSLFKVQDIQLYSLEEVLDLILLKIIIDPSVEQFTGGKGYRAVLCQDSFTDRTMGITNCCPYTKSLPPSFPSL